MQERLVKLSRVMSHALRHKPELYGLTLDSEGWVSTDALLNALRRHRNQWRNLQEQDILDMLAQSEKQRFEIRDGRIRAFYGHSVATKLEKEPSVPPALLYHGTTPLAAPLIVTEGLKPMNRQYVHLSADRETALLVARRRTNRPVILHVHAQQAQQHGIPFYLGNDMVWLAEPIPPAFITVES